MTGKIEDGGAAFPVSDLGTHGSCGMSLRDWFAGQAMTAILQAGFDGDLKRLDGENLQQACGRTAYVVADAMLAARKGGK